MSEKHVIPQKSLKERWVRDLKRYKLVYLIGFLCLIYQVKSRNL